MKKSLILTLTGLASASLCQAAVFANGSFESGLTSWTPGTETNLVNLSPDSFGAGASDGNEWIQFGTSSATGGVLSQTFDTMSGFTYEVLFDYGKYGNATGNGALRVSVDNLAATSQDFIDSSGSPYAADGSAYNTGTDTRNTLFTFVASGGSTTISFADISTNGASHDAALDNVRITAIPEPSSTSLLGLAGLTLILRRKK